MFVLTQATILPSMSRKLRDTLYPAYKIFTVIIFFTLLYENEWLRDCVKQDILIVSTVLSLENDLLNVHEDRL